METVEKFAAIASVTNPENGEVTLFISNEPWGPVVTGKNLEEAKSKIEEAFGLTMVANSFCSIKNAKEFKPAEAKGYKQQLEKITSTLENRY
jgi:hypothetical protein